MDLFHDISTPVFVDPVDMPTAIKALLKDGRRVALAGLERLASVLRARGLVVHTSAEWDYPTQESIIRRAQHSGADLIVTLCRARHRFPTLLGYTDWSLLRDSPVPVLLVKSRRAYRRSKILAAIDPLHHYSKPTGLDSCILREAQTLGRAMRTVPHVVHAYLPQPIGSLADKAPASLAERIEASTRNEARTAFNQALRGFPASSFRHHLIEAHPVVAITTMARRVNASIVVVKPPAFVTPIPRGRRGVYVISIRAAT